MIIMYLTKIRFCYCFLSTYTDNLCFTDIFDPLDKKLQLSIKSQNA